MRFDDRSEKVPLAALRLLFNPTLDTRVRALVELRAAASVGGERPSIFELAFTLENVGVNSVEAACVRLENEGRSLMLFRNSPIPGFIAMDATLLHPRHGGDV